MWKMYMWHVITYLINKGQWSAILPYCDHILLMSNTKMGNNHTTHRLDKRLSENHSFIIPYIASQTVFSMYSCTNPDVYMWHVIKSLSENHSFITPYIMNRSPYDKLIVNHQADRHTQIDWYTSNVYTYELQNLRKEDVHLKIALETYTSIVSIFIISRLYCCSVLPSFLKFL